MTFRAVLVGCGAMSKGWLSALDGDLLQGRVDMTWSPTASSSGWAGKPSSMPIISAQI